jgi:hypothetical protein
LGDFSGCGPGSGRWAEARGAEATASPSKASGAGRPRGSWQGAQQLGQADLHPAAGGYQGQSAPDDGVPGRGGRDVRSVRNRRQLHPSGWRAGPGAGDRQTSDTIVGFGDTRIHAETATFELRASEFANPRPSDQLTVDGQNFVIQGEPERRDPDRLVWTLDVRLP